MATAPPPEPAQAARAELQASLDRRRRGRRLRTGLILIASLATLAALSWSFGRQMVATAWLMVDRVEVDWKMTEENWHKGGVTHVFSHAQAVFDTDVMPAPKLELLAWLHRVESLDLSEIRGIKDEDLVALGALKHLVSIRLDRPANLPAWVAAKAPRLTDATLARLRGMADLQDLSLVDQNVTDAGLQSLVGLDRLETLNLEGNAITDAGLEPLRRLKGLKVVNLIGTSVTVKAAHDFEVARPGVTISVTGAEPGVP